MHLHVHLFFLIYRRRKDGKKGERDDKTAHKQMPTVSLWLFTELSGSRQSGLAAVAASVLSGTHSAPEIT